MSDRGNECSGERGRVEGPRAGGGGGGHNSDPGSGRAPREAICTHTCAPGINSLQTETVRKMGALWDKSY